MKKLAMAPAGAIGLQDVSRKMSLLPVGPAILQPPKARKRALTRPLSNEEKQAKNRLFVKRCYYKKRELLKTMRDQVAELESEFARVFTDWQVENAGAAAAFQRGERVVTLRDLYAELTLVRGALLDEQQQLKMRLADRFHFRQRLLQLYEPSS